ncbi:ABC transporter ATP-binding protein [Synergistales bacterium]|nr:ABC transporter ATP-binding protein [Synergistales bacterium]
MKEIIKEVYASIIQHKMRSLLTGFGIAWGMFILIVLLGAGNGFRSGMLNMFSGYASNSIWATGYWISEASPGGMQEGARIKFNEDIIKKLKKRFTQIKFISPEIPLDNWDPIIYKNNTGRFDVKGIGEDYMKIKLLEVEEGRLLNRIDYLEQRRSAIIGKRVKEILFEKENPIGKQVNISGVFFQVVGVLKEGTVFSMMDQNNIYVSDVALFSTYNINREYFTFGALLHEHTQVETFENELRNYLAQELKFSKNDRRALYVNNIQLQVKAFNTLFNGINIFLWILGVCFLLSGMIGITNIMLVVVKERTNEIGIRKAIGATPNSIIQLIISEALVITILFGLVGLLLGYGGIAVYNWVVIALQTGEQVIFSRASIEISVVLAAFLLLITSGVLAGIFPAQKAASIMPIETLNRVV